MFKIVKCVLTVENGTMNAVITMSGDGYNQLFVGTGEEAAAASDADYIKVVWIPMELSPSPSLLKN